MLLPGMSFENDWTGLVIRDSKRHVDCNESGALVWSEVGRRVTHVILGVGYGRTFYIDHPVFAADTADAYQRITA
jgi:hypothetical protein